MTPDPIRNRRGAFSVPDITPDPPAPATPPEDTQAAKPVESVAGTQASPAAREWSWLAQNVDQLKELCTREADITSHSRETFKWSTLADRLGQLHRKLTATLPAIELGRLRTPPLPGEEHAHQAAATLANETLELMSDVSTTAAASGKKARQSILKLCGKIALGLIATLGGVAACLLVPAAGPYLAAVAGIMGAGAIGTLVLAHREHNRHAQEFADLDLLLADMSSELQEPESQ